MLSSLSKTCSVTRRLWPEVQCVYRSSSAYTNENLINRSENTHTKNSGVVRKSQLAKRHPRTLSTLNTSVPLAATTTVVSKDERREFMSVFPDIVRDLTDAGRHLDIPDVTKWFAKVLQYNVPNGKKNRGLALVHSYRLLAPTSHLTPENIRLAQILGWCIEMLQAFFVVVDDIMDNSETRRGRPCWYRYEDLGVAAANDAILMEAGIYQLIKKYFKNKMYYQDILEMFHDITLKTALGQSLDLLSSQAGKKPVLELFTMDRYNAIVKYKTSYYSFQLPVGLAMYMSGIRDPEMHRQAKTILLEMGHFFQIQDDYLDCFGDPEVTGKKGSDIEDGKCSWLIVMALQRANPEQRALLEDCYGSSDSVKVAAVKALYEDLGLPATFSLYEEESYNLICTHIQQISRGLPHELFFKFMEKIYKRES